MRDLNHLQRIRQDLPATKAHRYLNTGTFGPLSIHVIQAIQGRFQAELNNGRLGPDAFTVMGEIYGSAREGVAHLLHADVQEIALTDNTGEGMNAISYGFDWQKGDEVITTNHEHISALAPLYQIRDRFGITLRVADLGFKGDQPAVKAIADLVTPRTRLISLSHVSFQTGAVLDVSAVTRFGREFGIPVVVDGAQSAGAIPLDVRALDVDFYAIPMQKWLCGPDGTGGLYIRRESQHYIKPTYVGYFSMKHEEGVEWELNENAQCFEVGGRQTASLAGQAAALNWLEQTVGYDWLFDRISTLNTYAYHALEAVPGIQLITPQPGASGLLSFTFANHEPAEVVERLNQDHNISIRSIAELKALRVSTGFYNTEEEIDALVQSLRTM